MARVMLLVPPSDYLAERWSHGELIPALGIGYIAAVLEREGHSVQIIDTVAEGLKISNVVNKIRAFDPLLVGITFTTENRFGAFKIARSIKKAFPALLIAVGGPHVWRTADDTLTWLECIDLVVRGEGEFTTLELVEALEHDKDLKDISGLSFRNKEGEIIHNPDRALIEDLNSLPFPARHLYPMEKYNYHHKVPGKGWKRVLNLMSSRGCPFNCNFCATPSNWGRKVRYVSVERVVDEIEELVKKYGAQALGFFDDTFSFDPRRVAEFCDVLISRKLDVSWYCEIRIDTVDRELLKKMKESGCFYIGMGVESASPRIINEVINKGRGFSIEKVTEVIKNCLDLDMIPAPFFIISHPTETIEEAKLTMDYIKFLRSMAPAMDISISIMHIYPGTPLEQLAREQGMIPQNFIWSLPHQKNIVTLPAAQGEVPLFIDKLSWEEISELLFEWSSSKKNYSLINKIPMVLKSIRSWQDFVRYAIMTKVFVKRKYRKMFS